MTDWLSKSDEDIARVLLKEYRRWGVKFQSRSSFAKAGWGTTPTPRMEHIFRVAAGKVPVRHTSPLIWDLREPFLRDEALYLTSILMWRKLQKYAVDCIGGIETAGIPVLAGILMVNKLMGGRPLCAFYLRKKRKKDGLRRIAEGTRVQKGTRVVIVDDILNTGATKRKLLDYCRDNGLSIQALIIAVETHFGGNRLLGGTFPVEAIFSRSDILSRRPIKTDRDFAMRVGEKWVAGRSDPTATLVLSEAGCSGAEQAARAAENRGPSSPSGDGSMSPEDVELVRLARDTLIFTATSLPRIAPTLGEDGRGSNGYYPFLGRYLRERGPVFVRISKREFSQGKWTNRLRGCQAVRLMDSHPESYAEMTIASTVASATRARKVIPGGPRFHKPVWPEELGSLSIFLYVVEEMIATSARNAKELAEEGQDTKSFGLVGVSLDSRYRGVICGDLAGVKTIKDQIKAVCAKAQNSAEIRPHQESQMRFVRMKGRWLYDPQRPKSTYF